MTTTDPRHDPSEKRRRLIAALATLLIVVAALVVMSLLYLRYTADEPRKWPPEDTSELLLAGEWVMRGDVAEPEMTDGEAPSAASEETPESHDLDDSGPAHSNPAPLVTATEESPAKERKKVTTEPTGPTKEELEAQERERQQRETAAKIAKRTAFGGSSSSSASSSGTTGSPSGNAATGAQRGTPGFNLRGRTLDAWDKPSGNATGTITVNVRVDRQGHVVKATYASGTGAIAGNAAARRSCEQAALKSRFSVDLDAPAEQVGTITYHFQ
ncbi:MAG: hypothetical protein LIO90_07720 [Bacteroidales bacterium]|nr:hypothetical protein [Bacteroidales bacterium]